MAYKIVFLRHGQSDWNLQNRFTGWVDVDLSEQGVLEARQAARQLAAEGFDFDMTFTSVLKRAIRTLWIVLDELDRMWLPVERHWRLNERHYGALQGLNKTETAAKYGMEQVHQWRRSYSVPPPVMSQEDPGHPLGDRRYAALQPEDFRGSESLQDTLKRVLPYWFDSIVPHVKKGERVLVSAHGNSLRALIKHLDDVSEEEITALNIPTGIPLVYELDEDLKPLGHRYLADPEKVRAAAEAVARQAEAGHKAGDVAGGR